MRQVRHMRTGLVPDSTGDRTLVISDECRQTAAWSEQGGRLPARLARHVDRCARCAERVRKVNEVHAALTLLRTQAVPAGLHARANGRALRMLRRAARASAAAKRLLAMRPNLTPWQRMQLHIMRVSLGAAAAVLALAVRAGVATGVERTRSLGEQLASVHWERHIDPDREWLDPTHLA